MSTLAFALFWLSTGVGAVAAIAQAAWRGQLRRLWHRRFLVVLFLAVAVLAARLGGAP